MYDLLCHSGMLFGSIATLVLVGTAVGGVGLLAASALRRATRRA
jgi:hypothetical protein